MLSTSSWGLSNSLGIFLAETAFLQLDNVLIIEKQLLNTSENIKQQIAKTVICQHQQS